MTLASRPKARHNRAAFLLSFSSFFVFPAIPLGATSALTIPYVISAFLAVLWLRRIRRTEWVPFGWMMTPLAISGAFVVLAGMALAPDVVVKVILTLFLTFLIVVPAGYLFRSGYSDSVIFGAAYAVLVHAGLGVYQVFAFDRGEFPFADILSTNPSMGMAADSIEQYVEFVKRPFGLFAEPSAMAACLGPWLVLLSFAIFTPSVKERFGKRRAVLLAALVAGLALVGLSRSGQAVPIAAGCAAVAIIPVFASRGRWTSRWTALVVGAAIVYGMYAWLSNRAAARFDLEQNESWQLRLASLSVAMESLGSSSTFLCGVGPGQSVWQMRSMKLGGVASGGVTAIWSVALTYAMETGLFGVACMLVVGSSILRSIWRSRARAAGMVCMAVWLIGLAFATSYPQQPSLWTAMAALLSWRFVAGSAFSEAGGARLVTAASASRIPSVPLQRASW
jgi:hypothetical protein